MTAELRLEGSQSFDEFYRQHRAGLVRALAVTLHSVDLGTDAADEALARACERWATVSTLDNPAGWVYRVGFNWGTSTLRRLRRPTPRWLTDPQGLPWADSPDPAIDHALARLNADQRAVVVCRLILGWSEAHTAECLGIRPGTVKSRLSRATEQLSASLASFNPHNTEVPR